MRRSLAQSANPPLSARQTRGMYLELFRCREVSCSRLQLSDICAMP